GKVDPLIGLKENVIIGKPIPAGTGMRRYRDVVIDTSIADASAPQPGDEPEPYDDDDFIDDENYDDVEPEKEEELEGER
ncbi:MAG TPA: hypothetical protein DCL38_09885, partial [Lachnospiraceae bacterium]|nr:hypothetical protein [Lachnospiraceae bacterium]